MTQDVNQLWSAIERLTYRIRGLLGVGTIQLIDDSAPTGQTAQVHYGFIGPVPEIKNGVAMNHNYGFSSNPPPGASVVTLSLSGLRTETIGIGTVAPIPGSQTGNLTRPLNLLPGESMQYGPAGAQIYLSAAGITVNAGSLPVVVNAAGQVVTVTSKQTVINGVTIDESGNITTPGTVDAAGGVFKSGTAYSFP